jgi:broad specificity phosphatase PhoE
VTTRLTFVCHGSTAATRRTAFPQDEPLEPNAVTAATELAERLKLPPDRQLLTGPTLRCRQTAELLGPPATVDIGLIDWDLGSWAGRTLDELAVQAADDLRAWISDPAARPHGGEPLTGLIGRIGRWLDEPVNEALERPPRAAKLVVVTHPAVIRSAIVHTLRAPADSFWRIDVAPLSVVEVRGRPGTWSLHT